MDAFSTPALYARAAPNPDKPIRTGRNRAYPRQLWWFVTCFIALVALCQFVSWVMTKRAARRPSSQRRTPDSEGGATSGTRRISWRRLPLALLNTYRVVAFRWTLNIGQSFTLTFAELFIVCAYIVALYVWSFVSSEFQLYMLLMFILTQAL